MVAELGCKRDGWREQGCTVWVIVLEAKLTDSAIVRESCEGLVQKGKNILGSSSGGAE
jgi:hypothetical protein